MIDVELLSYKILKYRRYLLLLSAGLYLGSLFLPAFYFHSGGRPLMGYQVLANTHGLFGPFVLEPRWYANLFYWYCMVCLCFRDEPANKAAIISTGLAISSFVLPVEYVESAAGGIPVEHLGVAAYLWLGAISVASCVNWLTYREKDLLEFP